MSEFVGYVQSEFKRSSSHFFLFCIKMVSGLVIGLTLALIMQEMLGKVEGESLIAFTFMIVVVTGLFLRVSRPWGLAGTLIFDLVAVLIGMVLRLYVMVAPGL